MTPIVLWDVDGTLLRAGDPLHMRALREALGEVTGRAVSLDGIVLGGNIERRIAQEALVRAGVAETGVARMAAAAIGLMGDRY